MRIGFMGDIVGKPGRNAVVAKISELKKRFSWDFIIANAENAAAGFGVTAQIGDELLSAGIDVLTSGNHIWDQKGTEEYLSKLPLLLRPANYPNYPKYPTPGLGMVIAPVKQSDVTVAVINLMGRTFMEAIDCPFAVGEKLVDEVLQKTPIVIIDFHAETTSEKRAAGWFFAGKATAVLGSHTHVQTADETVLEGRTGYITDAGMCGPERSVIGMNIDKMLFRFLSKRKVRFDVGHEDVHIRGVSLEVDEKTGRCLRIERFDEPWHP